MFDRDPRIGWLTLGVFLAVLAAVLFLSACAMPESPKPIEGLTITVKVVSPEWITAQAHDPRMNIGNKQAVAFYDFKTCTAYLPANVSQHEFIRLLDHEVGRHGLGELHDPNERWLDLPPVLSGALQRECVR